MFIAFLATAAAAVSPKPTAIDPTSWFSSDNYPIEAMKKGIEGSVGFEVDVDADGKPTACRVTTSSGQPILDKVTCDVVRSKARFDAAKGSDGRPVAGQYSNTAVWQIRHPLAPGHSALILDFATDAEHPTCTSQSVGTPTGPTCAQLLERLGTTVAALGNRQTKMVVLTSTTAAGEKPYSGEADWGIRFSYLASDQSFSKEGKLVACVSVAAEGIDAGQDACARSGGMQSSDGNTNKAVRTLRVEVSIYGVPRK